MKEYMEVKYKPEKAQKITVKVWTAKDGAVVVYADKADVVTNLAELVPEEGVTVVEVLLNDR